MNKEIMKALGFGEQIEAVEHSFCPFCKNPITQVEFRDKISKREYKISGLCQKCQDKMFGS